MSQLIINDYPKQFELIKNTNSGSRVTTLSVGTERITQAMRAAAR